MKSRLIFSEIIVLGMACLAPWAFGSVDAWAESHWRWGSRYSGRWRCSQGRASTRCDV